MYANDPMSVRQLRTADLIAADQSRSARSPVSHRRSWVRRTYLDRWTSRAPAQPAAATPPMVAPITPASDVPASDVPAACSLTPYHSLELFVGLDNASLAQLADSFLVLDVDPGHSLGRQGERSPEFVVVLEGRVGVSIDGAPLVVLDAGSHFGAIPLLDDGPAPYGRASFDVLEPCRVALAGRREFARILESQPLVAGRIRAIADVGRAYLRGRSEPVPSVAESTEQFPVHVTDVH